MKRCGQVCGRREKKGKEEEKKRRVKRGALEGVVDEGRVYDSAEKALGYVCD